ncbi:MAG: hypothetical protein EGR51_07600 [Oscillibacter sp.]|nr:hypothetical protein [Oscillibacter sp.]
MADKATQFTLIICLAVKHPALWYLVGLFVIKEGFQAIAGMILLRSGRILKGALITGKVCTTVLFISLIALVLLPELVLLLQDRGYNYLVFHRESGEVCGTSFSVRWLMDLQKSGIYMGSGGADVSYYYQLSFHDGRFWGEALGEKVVDRCQLNGMEVSEADFNTWYEENMTNDVTWYASDGAVIPENM